MCTFLSLPIELLLQILQLSLFGNPEPSNVLRLSRYIFELATNILYTSPHLISVESLRKFPACPKKRPRALVVNLAGGEVGGGAFHLMRRVFRSCLRAPRTRGVEEQHGGSNCEDFANEILPLESLRLCLHSTNSPIVDDVSLAALSLVNPKIFFWTGPDPAHHFSTAIVPAAFDSLVAHFPSWSSLRVLHLANVAFSPTFSASTLIPPIPTLETIYIGQATILPITPLAALLFHTDARSLSAVQLVDCYVESIWGPRIRRRDVERAAVDLATEDFGRRCEEKHASACDESWMSAKAQQAVQRVRCIVRCEVFTERIIGGDRVEGSAVLE